MHEESTRLVQTSAHRVFANGERGHRPAFFLLAVRNGERERFGTI